MHFIRFEIHFLYNSNHKLVTKQTKPEGVLVEKIMVAEALDIARETYFAILLDRKYDVPVMIGSPVGGVDIEEVCFIEIFIIKDMLFAAYLLNVVLHGFQVIKRLLFFR